MKRIISFFLILSVLLSFFGTEMTSLASSNTYAELLAFIDVEAGHDNTVDVSLYITPQYEMDILGMNFSIDYSYSFERYEYPFTFNKDKVHLHENFSDATIVTNASTSGKFDYYWDSASPVTVSADTTILLATMSLDVADSTHDGEYIFNLTCKDFYRAVTLEGNESIDIAGVAVDTSFGNVTFWYGEKLETTNREVNVVQSGTQDLSHAIFINKTVNSDLCYIQDTSVATIDKIDNSSTNATISIVGRSIGTTKLFVIGGYNDCETLVVTIHVTKPTPYMMTIANPPTKTTYEVGEALDLTGLELRVEYNNYDVEYISSGFVPDTYDFSTAGDKRIKVSYRDLYVYVDVIVVAADDDAPDVPVILYGDGNDDGLVDTKDLVLLRRYLANYNYDTGLSTVEIGDGGDANGDGVIDTKDLVLIRRYLANYNYDTGSSTIILGPQN